MEAVKEEQELFDDRTDLEELKDLEIKLRYYRRKILAKAEESIKNNLRGYKTPDDKSVEVAELWKMYSYLDKSYASLMKICYPKGSKGNNNPGVGNPDMAKVKAMKNSVGQIVTKIG